METFLHKNGGGRIFGVDGAISSDSLLDKSSFIEGETFVSCGSSVTDNSSIKNSTVSMGDIRGSVLVRSHVSNSLIYASGLEGAVIRGTKDRATVVQNCLLSDRVVIEGATVRGFELNGPFLIHNDWNHAPRHHVLRPCEGVEMGISECVPGFSHCGCECRPIDEWIKKKELLRKVFVKRGWAPESIDIVAQLFEQWRVPVASTKRVQVRGQNDLYVVPSSVTS